MRATSCRACESLQLELFIDLGLQPISNNYLSASEDIAEKLPLEVLVCRSCSFLQLSVSDNPSVHFNDRYPYFSGYSQTWIEHCKKLAMDLRLSLNLQAEDFVIELASNDGTLIREFQASGQKILGVEPSENVARTAIQSGVPTINNFFGFQLSEEIKNCYPTPKLILGCNVLAHVPDLFDFLSGVTNLMDATTVACFEFPHATRMIKNSQFDTIYHEHYSYLTLTSLIPVLSRLNLRIFKVEEHDLHGGSLRIYVSLMNSAYETEKSIEKILLFENAFSPLDEETKSNFRNSILRIKNDLEIMIREHLQAQRTIVIFGAAAKGTTLLNFVGLTSELIEFAVDSSLVKQYKYIPGTGILIRPPDDLAGLNPDVVLILAWNFAKEIADDISKILASQPLMIVPIPAPHYFQK
jgi:C-methyltransferase C-terminal domain/Putative zinc binding domain